jgi:radical SAM protein with 4Fe4S-binding SPASM domain
LPRPSCSDASGSEKKVLQDCAKCAFFDLCYSGCMFHSLKDSKVLAEKDYH